jgi:hypothetical protein
MSIAPVNALAPVSVTTPPVLLVTTALPLSTALTKPFSNPKLLALNVPASTTPSTNRNAPTLWDVFPSVSIVVPPPTVNDPIVNNPAPLTTSVPPKTSIAPVNAFAPLNTTEPPVFFVTPAFPLNTALTHPFSNPKLLALKVPFSTTPSTNRNAPTFWLVVPSPSTVAAPLTVTVPDVNKPTPLTKSVPASTSSDPLKVFAPLKVTMPPVLLVTTAPPFNTAPTTPLSNP